MFVTPDSMYIHTYESQLYVYVHFVYFLGCWKEFPSYDQS